MFEQLDTGTSRFYLGSTLGLETNPGSLGT